MKVHPVEHGLHDFPTDIFKVDVNAIGSGSGELLFPRGVFVVDGGIEAEIVHDPSAFFIASGDTNNAAAVNFANLPGDASGGAGGSGYDQGFARLRFADFKKAEISGKAVDAEKTQEIGIGKEGDGRKLLEGTGFLGVDEDVVLEAGEPGNLVALLIVGMPRFHDFREAERAHDLTEDDGRHVLGYVGHPDAHGGVDGEIFDAGEGLAVRRVGKGASESWRSLGAMRPLGRATSFHCRMVLGMEKD